MRALIVLGGEAPSRELLERCARQADHVTAADKGLEAFDGTDLIPDLLIGDMDSVDPALLERYAPKAEQRRLNCIKDDTDGVDALDVMIARGATEITLLGALGGRLDHAIGNLMLLIRAHRAGVKAQIVSDDVRITRVDGTCVLEGAMGDTVSLLPMGCAQGVSLSGFFYCGNGKTLTVDYPLGISNVVTEPTARVSVDGGDLLMFWYHRL